MTDETTAATPALKTIANWSAKRSGPGITIEGWENGRRTTVTNVAEICSDADGPLATLRTEGGRPAVQYRLA